MDNLGWNFETLFCLHSVTHELIICSRPAFPLYNILVRVGDTMTVSQYEQVGVITPHH